MTCILAYISGDRIWMCADGRTVDGRGRTTNDGTRKLLVGPNFLIAFMGPADGCVAGQEYFKELYPSAEKHSTETLVAGILADTVAVGHLVASENNRDGGSGIAIVLARWQGRTPQIVYMKMQDDWNLRVQWQSEDEDFLGPDDPEAAAFFQRILDSMPLESGEDPPHRIANALEMTMKQLEQLCSDVGGLYTIESLQRPERWSAKNI